MYSIFKYMENEMWQLLYPSSMDELQLLDPSVITFSRGELLDLSEKPFIQEIIDLEWDKRLYKKKFEALDQGKKAVLFDGPQIRVSGFEALDSGLDLHIAPTGYKDFIGTNGLAHTNPGLHNLIREEGRRESNVSKYMSNALAICAAIRTKDNYIIVTWMSDANAEYGKTWHTIGGHPEMLFYVGVPSIKDFDREAYETDFVDLTKIDLANDMAKEILKETGMPKDSYELYFLGLVQNMETLKLETVYFAEADVLLTDIIRYPRHERYELIEFMGLRPRHLKELIQRERHLKKFCPPGLSSWEMLFHLQDMNLINLFVSANSRNQYS